VKRILILSLLVAGCTGGIVDLGTPSQKPVVIPAPTLDCSGGNPDPRCPQPLPTPKPHAENAPVGERTITHQYAQAGTYIVTLTIVAGNGQSAVFHVPIDIAAVQKPRRRAILHTEP
jgi:hypothetical protein